jgi:hypothetical protein
MSDLSRPDRPSPERPEDREGEARTPKQESWSYEGLARVFAEQVPQLLRRYLGPDLACPPGRDLQEWETRLIIAVADDILRRLADLLRKVEPCPPEIAAEEGKRREWLDQLAEDLGRKIAEGLGENPEESG